MTQIERDILTTGAGKPDQDWQISPGKRGILAIPLLSAPRQGYNAGGFLYRSNIAVEISALVGHWPRRRPA